MRLLVVFAWAAVMMILGVVPGLADKRVALVIGNGAYAKVPPLANPPNDAGAVAAMLRNGGFDVVQAKTNLDLAAMRRALREFIGAARDADVAVVFYAGHGIEVNGTNYLIPVDAVLEHDFDVEDETVSLDRVSQVIEGARRLRVVILDACRDNPFAASMKRTLGSRSIGRGLGRVDVATADTLVAFAARAGSTAADGSGANSPYTTALLQHLVTPGLDVRLALGRVRDQVLASTGGKQEPFVYGSLGGAEVSLLPAVKTEPAPPMGALQPGEAERAWLLAQNTTSTAVLEDFVRRFGETFYASLARARLEELKRKNPAQPAAPLRQLTSAAGGSVHALIVGINRYRSPIVPTLKGAVNDAADLRDSLIRNGVAAGTITYLVDEAATREAVLAGFKRLASAAKPGDLVIVTFAAHGTRIPATAGLRREDIVLLHGFDQSTPDLLGDPDFIGFLTQLANKGIDALVTADLSFRDHALGGSDPEPAEAAARGGSREAAEAAAEAIKILRANVDPKDYASDDSMLKRMTFLLAAEANSPAREVDIAIAGTPTRRGALSYALARALEGTADADHNGATTRKELFNYVKAIVLQYAQGKQAIVTGPDRGPDLLDAVVFRNESTTPVGAR
ncbi:MAG: caspase family protein [Xanthobacteraceae bacterium]